MTNNVNLTAIPAKRYFTLSEVCELVQISPAQFAHWQHENGVVIGYGGDRYTRLDVVKLLKLKETFDPFVDSFNQNAADSQGNPAADADEVRDELKNLLAEVERALTN